MASAAGFTEADLGDVTYVWHKGHAKSAVDNFPVDILLRLAIKEVPKQRQQDGAIQVNNTNAFTFSSAKALSANGNKAVLHADACNCTVALWGCFFSSMHWQTCISLTIPHPAM